MNIQSYLQSIFKTHAKNEMAHAQRFFNLLADNSSTKQKNVDLAGGYPFTKGTLIEIRQIKTCRIITNFLVCRAGCLHPNVGDDDHIVPF